MTEAKRMSEEQRQEYLRVMRAAGMPEEILQAMEGWGLQQSGHTKGEYRAYELGRKEALAELHAKWGEDFLDEVQCIRDAFGHLSTGGDRTVHEALLKDAFLLLDHLYKIVQTAP